MGFGFDISDELRETLSKLARKDRARAIAVRKKMRQIARSNETDIEHFKNLMGDMSHLKRVHVGSFVLTFRLKGNTIIFEDFDHHDKIYRKRA